MRNKLFALVGIFTLLISTTAAQAITIGFSPSDSVTEVGSAFDVEVTISDLGDFSAPSVGVFDLDVSFDPTIISFNSVAFGDPILGDQLDLFGLGSITASDNSLSGIVNIFELSFDSALDLDTLQAGNFTLATLTFDAISPGTSLLDVTVLVLGDSIGEPLDASILSGTAMVSPAAAVPEPGTFSILLLGLLGMSFRLLSQAKRA